MIILCTPTRDTVHSGFTSDLVSLIQTTPDVAFGVALGTSLPNQRTLLVRQSLKSNASHVLFIDSDMRFPMDTARRLLAHNLAIVGANCKHRQANKTTAIKNGFPVSSENKKGLEAVDSLGFGVTLIKAEVFKKIGEPWFGMPFDGEKYIGEDIFFCAKARENLFTINVDHDLSKEVKHIGSIEL